MLCEVFAVAAPLTVIVSHKVFAVVAFHHDREGQKLKAFVFLGIAMRLFDLADHARIHHGVILLLSIDYCLLNKKARSVFRLRASIFDWLASAQLLLMLAC
jgi:hypothetical protein